MARPTGRTSRARHRLRTQPPPPTRATTCARRSRTTTTPAPVRLWTPSTSSAVKLHRYDGNANGAIERNEVIDAINDYLFGTGTERDEVIEVINLYLFPIAIKPDIG